MGGGPESRCVGRVYGADGAVRRPENADIFNVNPGITTGNEARIKVIVQYYRGADKSLARTWKETSYSDLDLQYSTKTYGVQTTGINSRCFYAISLSRCRLFPSRVGLRTYQQPCVIGLDYNTGIT